MKFVDSVKIHVRSGNGGSGCTAFRREKYIPHGGPDGGDGGKGGDVFLVGDHSKNTLLDLSFQQHQHAEHGISGSGSDKHGRNGEDLHIRVPLGTVVKDIETGEVFLEVVEKKTTCFFREDAVDEAMLALKIQLTVLRNITSPENRGMIAGSDWN